MRQVQFSADKLPFETVRAENMDLSPGIRRKPRSQGLLRLGQIAVNRFSAAVYTSSATASKATPNRRDRVDAAAGV